MSDTATMTAEAPAKKKAPRALSDENRKLRAELVDLAVQGVRSQAEAGYYNPEQVAELTKQLDRVAKYLCVKN